MNKILVFIFTFGLFFNIYCADKKDTLVRPRQLGLKQSRVNNMQLIEEQAKLKKVEVDERFDEACRLYNYNMRKKMETKRLIYGKTLKESMEEHNIKIVRVKNLTEAKLFAKEIVADDREYIYKQLNSNSRFSKYEINEDLPFYIKDASVGKIEIQHMDLRGYYTYDEAVIEYPSLGLSNVRTFKYITLSLNDRENNNNTKFEEGGVVFIDERLDIDHVSLNRLFIVTVTATIPKVNIIDIVKRHNKKIREENEGKVTLPGTITIDLYQEKKN